MLGSSLEDGETIANRTKRKTLNLQSNAFYILYIHCLHNDNRETSKYCCLSEVGALRDVCQKCELHFQSVYLWHRLKFLPCSRVIQPLKKFN